MCLLRSSVNLFYSDIEKAHVGVGYKLLYCRKWIQGNYAECDPFTDKRSRVLKPGQWYSWKIGDGTYQPNDLSYEYEYMSKYPNGFHVLLSQKDAENYQTDKRSRGLYKVLFKDLFAVGDQELYGKTNPIIRDYETGVCAIAGQIKVIEKLSFSDVVAEKMV